MLRQSSLIAASIQEILGVTLGPYGQDVIIGDEISGDREGCAIMSNDGAEVLRKLRVRMTHPVGLLLADLAAAQDKDVGDGTTSAVVLATELIVSAQRLMQSYHVSLKSVIDGYSAAAQFASSWLEDKLSITLEELLQQPHISGNMNSFLHKIASTSLSSKSLSSCKERLATIAVQSIGSAPLFMEIGGGSVNDSCYVKNGICICNSKQDPSSIPINDPPCVLTSEWVAEKANVSRVEIVCVLNINFPQLALPKQPSLDIGLEKELASKLVILGITTLFSSHVLPLSLVAFLKHESKSALRIIDGLSIADLQSIANCTRSEIITSYLTITQSNPSERSFLGNAQLISPCKIGKETTIIIFHAPHSNLSWRSDTIILRGASPEIIKEIQRSIHDARCVLAKTLKCDQFVGGGGAVEASLACAIQDYAMKSAFGGEMQEVLKGYANALLVLPKYLAKNAGVDSLDAVSKLMHYKRANKDRESYGLGLDLSREQLSKGVVTISNMLSHGVIEPINIKARVISFATETSITIIRVDELLEC